MFYVPEFPRIGILKCRVYVGEFSVRCDDKLVICCLILTKVLDNLSPRCHLAHYKHITLLTKKYFIPHTSA